MSSPKGRSEPSSRYGIGGVTIRSAAAAAAAAAAVDFPFPLFLGLGLGTLMIPGDAMIP